MVSLVRWNPNGGVAVRPFFRPFRLLEEVEEMARSAFETGLTPKMDMYEEEKDLVIKAEMPGIRKKDLDIKLDGDVLTIKAEKKEEKKEGEEGTTHYYRERSFGQYVRYMTLPAKVDAENITATLKKGLLEIRMPRAEAPEVKQIEIKTK
ncbi:MAG: Hsp20/alpha crystallin family protein [Dehalococcoidales bacterium]|nr:Hsp20/alpha crystallin family protein [Dehalococcoidales bacterium]